MPFTNKNKYSWSTSSILANAPRHIGVYGIYGTTGCIYVGHGDIQARLLGHQGGNDYRIAQSSPSGFMFEMCATEQAAREREKTLIAELRPALQPAYA